jgi:hypothetical protein
MNTGNLNPVSPSDTLWLGSQPNNRTLPSGMPIKGLQNPALPAALLAAEYFGIISPGEKNCRARVSTELTSNLDPKGTKGTKSCW